MQEDNTAKRGGRIWVVAAIALFVLVLTIMAISSRKPGDLLEGDLPTHVKGAAFITVNRLLIDQMLRNWTPNDLFWPSVFLDNIPNFQIGQLEVVRYNTRVLRDNLSRMRTTDALDPFAEAAFTSLSNDPYKWWFPSAESKWKQAAKNLDDYLSSVKSGRSYFYPRADNLVELLQQYASLMGGVNTRLINAPPDRKAVMPIDDADKAQQSNLVEIDIPWHRIDDNFYYAQGVAYALYYSFKAIRLDFLTVLRDKNSLKLVDKIMESLERCQFEPLLVLNGSPSSIFANHSLNLSGVFNDARQKVDSLIVALTQG